jgi:hypothetical protein
MGNGEWSRQGLSALLAGSFYMMMIPQQKQKIPFLLLSVRPFYDFCFGPDRRPVAKRENSNTKANGTKGNGCFTHSSPDRDTPSTALDDVRHTPNNNDNKDLKGSRRADAKRREKNIQFNKRGQRKTDQNQIQGKQASCPGPQLVELAEAR